MFFSVGRPDAADTARCLARFVLTSGEASGEGLAYEIRLLDGVASAEGGREVAPAIAAWAAERLSGLWPAMLAREVERELGPCDFRYGEGVVRVKGLKLCPIEVPLRFVEPFQRGRLSEGGGGRALVAVGVGDA